MQFLLHIDVFVGALFSIVPVLAHPHQYYRRYTLSKNCFRDFTFADIADPREYLLTSQRNANVSSGDLCCDLCMRSSENCLFSRYDEETGQCALIINDDINQDTWDLYEPQNSVEEVCKAGVLIGGAVSTKKMDLNHFWIGPCWIPVDLSDGLTVPGPSNHPVYTDDGMPFDVDPAEDLPGRDGEN